MKPVVLWQCHSRKLRITWAAMAVGLWTSIRVPLRRIKYRLDGTPYISEVCMFFKAQAVTPGGTFRVMPGYPRKKPYLTYRSDRTGD